MNVPPTEFVRVRPEALRAYTLMLLRQAGLASVHASLLAKLLVDSDLRGVYSHGTRQVHNYVGLLHSGSLNHRARVRVVAETNATAVLDGGGGLGYLVAWRAAGMAIAKAKATGVGVAVTRHHGHYGAAGHYSRRVAAADCIGISASAVRMLPEPGLPPYFGSGCPPVSIAIPNGSEPPIVPDMGLYISGFINDANVEGLFRSMPDAFFKFFGLGAAVQALGGMLAGVYLDDLRSSPYDADATQGTFIAAIDVAKFLPVAEFRRHVDAYVAAVGRLQPFPGYDRMEIPGGPEWRREDEYARVGIPVTEQHLETLDAAAAIVGAQSFRDWVRALPAA